MQSTAIATKSSKRKNSRRKAKVQENLNSDLARAKKLIENQSLQQAQAILEPILKAHEPGTAPTLSQQQALLYYADAQRAKKLFEDAYRNYATVAQSNPALTEQILPSIYKCIRNLSEPMVSETSQAHLIAYLTDRQTANASIDYLTRQTLKQLYHFGDDTYPLELGTLANHKLLITSLKQLSLNDPELELFLNDLRTQLLVDHVEHSHQIEGQNESTLALTNAMAIRAYRNEYINYASPEERQIVGGLNELLTNVLKTNESLDACTGTILTLLMYMPLEEIAANVTVIQLLGSNNEAACPLILRELRELLLIDRREEELLAQKIPALALSENSISKRVRDQYEQNPYPRWHSISVTDTRRPYLEAYSHLKHTATNVDKFTGQLECLVAGCGTGKQPISLATNVADMHITGIDLSLASLAYAARMARGYGVPGIDFYQGDILNLNLTNKSFDVIECAGVLHHMEDPEAGLQKLLEHLAPDGLLMLGLYSKTARRDVTQFREQYGDRLGADSRAIAEVRQPVLHNPQGNFVKWADFYSTSECRDLLFHTQEVQYTVPMLQTMLENAGLRFLGFHSLGERVFQDYYHSFPKDPLMTDLDNWHIFEQDNPDTFRGMYSFHCQRERS